MNTQNIHGNQDTQPTNRAFATAALVYLGWYIADSAEKPSIGVYPTHDLDGSQERDTVVQFALPASEEERDTLELLVIGSVNRANEAPTSSLVQALTRAAAHGFLQEGKPGEAVGAFVSTAFVKAAVAVPDDRPAALVAEEKASLTLPRKSRVIVTVDGGVADFVADEGVDVVIFDRDDHRDDPGLPGVPAHYADLAERVNVKVTDQAAK